jgi:NitT/TauT family transport system substrate-binding protein
MGTTLWSLALSLVLLVASSLKVGAQEHTRVTVFEAWFIHNESMGTPTAVEKGFFSGLDVTVIGGGPGLSPIERVMAEARKGGIVFGVDYPYNVLEAREKQKLPLVVVAHDFQKSAVRLISWQEIKTPRDIQGTVATWSGYDKQVKAAIGPDWGQRITLVNQQGDPATIGSWLKKDYPFAHAMLYNEILIARRLAKKPYWTYAFADFGIDWPDNVVFTTEESVTRHPQAIQAFVSGRYQGYAYALANRAEAMQILLKYNASLTGQEQHELEGMEAIQSLMLPNASPQNGLGYIDAAAWERVGRDLMQAGFYTSAPNVKAAYTTAFPSGVTP